MGIIGNYEVLNHPAHERARKFLMRSSLESCANLFGDGDDEDPNDDYDHDDLVGLIDD